MSTQAVAESFLIAVAAEVVWLPPGEWTHYPLFLIRQLGELAADPADYRALLRNVVHEMLAEYGAMLEEVNHARL